MLVAVGGTRRITVSRLTMAFQPPAHNVLQEPGILIL